MRRVCSTWVERSESSCRGETCSRHARPSEGRKPPTTKRYGPSRPPRAMSGPRCTEGPPQDRAAQPHREGRRDSNAAPRGRGANLPPGALGVSSNNPAATTIEQHRHAEEGSMLSDPQRTATRRRTPDARDRGRLRSPCRGGDRRYFDGVTFAAANRRERSRCLHEAPRRTQRPASVRGHRRQRGVDISAAHLSAIRRASEDHPGQYAHGGEREQPSKISPLRPRTRAGDEDSGDHGRNKHTASPVTQHTRRERSDAPNCFR